MSDYPRMLYHADGRTATVSSAEQEKSIGHGWGHKPHDVHLNQRSGTAPNDLPPVTMPGAVVDVDPSGRDDLVDKIVDGLEDRLRELGVLPPLDETETETAPDGTTAPKRRGRRPKNPS